MQSRQIVKFKGPRGLELTLKSWGLSNLSSNRLLTEHDWPLTLTLLSLRCNFLVDVTKDSLLSEPLILMRSDVHLYFLKLWLIYLIQDRESRTTTSLPFICSTPRFKYLHEL